MQTYAPIALFTYNRADHTQRAVESLLKNAEAKYSDLFIFSDGPKTPEKKAGVEENRKYIHTISGFKSISIVEREKNWGLANSLIAGITEVINKYGKVIVVEDDLILSPYFLQFMNEGLEKYKDDDRVGTICGYVLPVKKPLPETFFLYFMHPWGWATWKDRWNSVDWNISDWNQFKTDKKAIQRFKETGGSDMFSMLESCMEGGGMWDIRFCYNMFKQNRYSVIPFLSKVENVGFNELATHCKTVKYNRFKYIFITSKTYINRNQFSYDSDLPVVRNIKKLIWFCLNNNTCYYLNNRLI